MLTIAVAGCGHGGLVAAGLLAEAGHDVRIYEKKSREELYYDWTDIFDINCFEFAGIEFPPIEKYTNKGVMTFINPSKTVFLSPPRRKDDREVKMERKDIYEHLLAFAEKRGVKIFFDTFISGPLVKGGKVAGLKSYAKEIPADLVIDACGMDSGVRKNLPDAYGIDKNFGERDRFFAYRAFYNRLEGNSPVYNYKIYLIPNGMKGISWVAAEKDYMDILIGRFYTHSLSEAEAAVENLRLDNPLIGKEILRGGSIVPISVRKPLPLFVGDGYAAIGDSAGMTVPIIGSGIANAVEAGKMLSDAVIQSGGGCRVEHLWPYQYAYMQRKACNASLELIKNFLIGLDMADVDVLFEKGIISENEMNAAGSGNSVSLTQAQMIDKLKKGKNNLKLLMSLASVISKGKKLTNHIASMPKAYQKKVVFKWADKYRTY